MTEIYAKLTDIQTAFQEQFLLEISERLSENDIVKNRLSKPAENSDYFLIGGDQKDIPVGTTFDVVFSRENPANHVFIKATLEWVNVNPSYEIDYLPRGYGGFGLIKFSEKIPELFDSLNYYTKTRINDNSDVLFLVSKDMYKMLMESYK